MLNSESYIYSTCLKFSLPRCDASGGHLMPPQTTKTLVNNSIVMQVVKLYNHISAKLKGLDSTLFKKILRQE